MQSSPAPEPAPAPAPQTVQYIIQASNDGTYATSGQVGQTYTVEVDQPQVFVVLRNMSIDIFISTYRIYYYIHLLFIYFIYSLYSYAIYIHIEYNIIFYML